MKFLTQPALEVERQRYPSFAESLPTVDFSDRDYLLRFVRSADELDAVLRLRYEVFNLELNEGLDSSYETQRDADGFDTQCHHLMVLERKSGNVIGTYRMQTREMAQSGDGFYSAGEFDLSGFPVEVLDDAVELGRACVAKDHRNSRVLFLLWRGLAAYLAQNRKRYMFGCCSLTSQDVDEGLRVLRHLEAHGHLHPLWRVQPLPGLECEGAAVDGATVLIPRLMKIYLTYGAKICSAPAIDRFFKTIDYLALIDIRQLSPQTYRYFFR